MTNSGGSKLLIPILIIITLSSCTVLDAISNRMWVEAHAGKQCEPRTYESLDHAMDFLTSNRIKVYKGKVTRPETVCNACGCSIGTIYQVKIKDSDYVKAKMLGWREVN